MKSKKITFYFIKHISGKAQFINIIIYPAISFFNYRGVGSSQEGDTESAYLSYDFQAALRALAPTQDLKQNNTVPALYRGHGLLHNPQKLQGNTSGHCHATRHS